MKYLGSISDSKDLVNKEYVDSLIAPTYSSSSAYNVGESVLYNNKLYKCNTAIASPGEVWTAGHWTEVKVAKGMADSTLTVAGAAADAKVTGDRLGDLKSEVDFNSKEVKSVTGNFLFPKFESGQVVLTDGVLVYSTNGNRIRTPQGTSVHLLSGTKIHVPAGYGIFGTYYRNNTYTSITTKYSDYTVPYEADYYFTILKNPESAISESEINEIISSFVLYQGGNEILKINRSVERINETIDRISYLKYEKTYTGKGWIRYSNGELVSSNATYYFAIKSYGVGAIKAFLASDTNVLCAIAFYSTDEISTNGYLQAASVDFESGTHDDGVWYSANIPSNCKLIVVTTKVPSASVADYQILISSNAFAVETEKNIVALNDGILNTKFKYIYHFGMQYVSTRTQTPPVIPPQSIFDIRNAANLGYKCIEANVWWTSDGKYVVTHGINAGQLGHDFDTLNGEDAAGTPITTNTLSYLQSNFVHRSSNPDYRVPISTLEDFLHECARLNLIVSLQYQDTSELNRAIGIMGKNIILYNGSRTHFSGVISRYATHETVDEILAYCNIYGKPFIYLVDTPSRFSDTELKNIAATLHKNGYYIGSAYNTQEEIEKLSSFGFDFFSVGSDYLNTVILNGKKLIFNPNGTVAWENASIDN